MSGLDVSGLADAAAWINERRPFVAVGEVASFADTRRVHEQLEAGRTVRTDDGLAGKSVLRPWPVGPGGNGGPSAASG